MAGYNRGESNALPAGAYRDPFEYLQAMQERSCRGCKHLGNVFGRDFCAKGKKNLTKCKLFAIKVVI
jgi:hypothetical protein